MMVRDAHSNRRSDRFSNLGELRGWADNALGILQQNSLLKLPSPEFYQHLYEFSNNEIDFHNAVLRCAAA
ncbi:MAG: hypothetical protein H7244_14520 [Herminiimonas sp.]|nr:hypothetical protein [Herminiimonas sp.]